MVTGASRNTLTYKKESHLMLIVNSVVILCVSRQGSTHMDRLLKELYSDADYAGK